MQVKNKRIMIIGDTIIDEFIQLEQLNSSAEEVPTYKEVSRKRLTGGATNVVKSCLRLGAERVHLIDNTDSFYLTNDDGITSDEWLRMTHGHLHECQDVIKQRYHVNGKKSFKMNHITNEKKLFERNCHDADFVYIKNDIEWFKPDIILACDNRHGMFADETIRRLVKLCNERNLKLFVDAQLSQNVPDWSLWKGAHSIFFNEKEAASASAVNGVDFGNVHLKRGEKGSILVSRGCIVKSWQGYEVDVVDTLGAGDAYLAAYAVYEDLRISNAWAALSCTKHGTELPQFEELRSMIDETSSR